MPRLPLVATRGRSRALRRHARPACAGGRRRPPGSRPAACGLASAAQRLARAVGVAVDQELHHVRDVLLRAGEPVLQGQEIGAHVLRGAGDEAQDLRQPAQHLHLLRAGGGPARRTRRSWPRACRAAASAAPAGRSAGASMLNRPMRVSFITSAADIAQTIASQCVAARLQRRQHRQEVLLHEQHRRDDDVAAARCRPAQRCSAAPSPPHSAAACTASCRPGIVRASVRLARVRRRSRGGCPS